MFQGTKLYSISTGSCPKCHKGKLFLKYSPLKPKSWIKMNEKCENCGLKYEIEPGFFQGAMYVSYALGVAISVLVFFVFFFIIGFDPFWYLIGNALVLLILAPFIFKFARAIYLNTFIDFVKEEQNSQEVDVK